MRGGLHSVVLDSPEQADWTNPKHANASTRFGCQRCEVFLDDLHDHCFDFRKHQRTADGVDAQIEYAREGRTAVERAERERQHGVVIPDTDNPLKGTTFDRILQAPMDILHQDSLARIFCFYFAFLTLGLSFLLALPKCGKYCNSS